MDEKLFLMDEQRKWYLEMESTPGEDAVKDIEMTTKDLEYYIYLKQCQDWRRLTAILKVVLPGYPGSPAGNESTCNVGDSGLIPGSGRSTGEGIGYPLQDTWGFPCGSAGKESTCNVGDWGSIPGLGRSPGEGKGYPLQYSGLENSRDCIVHGVVELDTIEQLSLTTVGKMLSNPISYYREIICERKSQLMQQTS